MDADAWQAPILSQQQELHSKDKPRLHKDEQLQSRNHEIEPLKLLIANAGTGANHRTGWTGLVAKLIQQSGEKNAKLTDATAATEAGSSRRATLK